MLLSPPLGITQLLNERQLDLVFGACSDARPLSRVNSCRPRKTNYWVDLPILASVHLDIASFLNQKFELSLKPFSNSYYLVEEGGVFPPRTLAIGYGVSLAVLLRASNEVSDWAFLSSHAVDDDVRNSSSFNGGLVRENGEEDLRYQSFEPYIFLLSPGDAVLFSGSHCLHSFDGLSPDERHILMFHFTA